MHYLDTRQIQDLLFDMLLVFDEMCNEHSIRYSLDGGTLLGAVRHQGFIPWDDDLDVLVPRPDYEKLISHPDWLPQGYHIDSKRGNSELNFLPYAKFVNMRWRAQEPALTGLIDEHLWIDIFPADAVPDDDGEARRLLARQKKLHDRAVRSIVNVDAVTSSSYKLAIKKVLFPVHRRLFPYKKQYESMARNATAIPYGTTSRIGNITWSYYRPDFIPADDFEHLTQLEFEGREFPAIPSWDSLLSQHFGDYMKLPPESERATHGTKVWEDVDGQQ